MYYSDARAMPSTITQFSWNTSVWEVRHHHTFSLGFRSLLTSGKADSAMREGRTACSNKAYENQLDSVIHSSGAPRLGGEIPGSTLKHC